MRKKKSWNKFQGFQLLSRNLNFFFNTAMDYVPNYILQMPLARYFYQINK